MNSDNREVLYQFLGGNWYDRPESDAEIINEFVNEEDPEYVAEVAAQVRSFLASAEPIEAKAEFIKNAAWRYIEGGPEAYMRWLEGVLLQLERANVATPVSAA